MTDDRPQATEHDVALIGRATQQRAMVLGALVVVEGFISAQALHRRLVADGSPVGLSTVYRTLTALVEAGRADVVRAADGERLFRHRPGPDHRHYLICTECGLSLPVESGPVERWAARIARTSGFADVRHAVELSGVCPDCDRKADQTADQAQGP
ncbi:Fur family transcriptional regulator [Streptomyces sp. NPDC051173]|uniref:Fur family transcriptional regulator n=1 Tax=Streptomyces sp. NPDC051173 TaxID=3155164 RepID=UPI00344B1D26